MSERRQQIVCASLVALLLVAGAVSVGVLSSRAAPRPLSVSVAAVAPTPSTTASTTTTVVYDAPVVTTSTNPATTTTRPRPVPATRAVPRPAPTQPPTTAFSPPPPPTVSDSTAPRCEAARAWVAAAGLSTPAGWDYRCPDLARDDKGAQHWGIACWNCDGGSYVGVNIVLIGSSDATLRYVVAHEICHAIEFMTLGLSTELTADLRAALHGAPRP